MKSSAVIRLNVVVERQFIQDIDTQRGQCVRTLGRQSQPERRIVRAEQLARVRLERQHRQRRVGPGGVGGADDAMVAEMDAVEIAQRDGGAARVGRDRPPVT